MKRLTIISLSALLTLAATPDAFAWGAVSGPRGGAAYRGPMGGAAVRTPSGAAAVRTPSGAAAARGPYGGTAVRGPVYGGGTVYRGATVVTPGVGYGVASGAAAATHCFVGQSPSGAPQLRPETKWYDNWPPE